MLLELNIRNFAVIESLDVDFQSGMTVFTGETGAGKSIIVDAMGLILGDRADSSIVRSDADKTELSARFLIKEQKELEALLKEQEIDIEDELLIRRVISKDGRSRAFINGCASPIQLLKTIGEQLVDIHGQHAHQSLLRKDNQRQLLDDFAEHEQLLNDINKLFEDWSDIQKQLVSLSGNDEGREAQLNLLTYQVDELQALHLEENEFVKLEEEFKRLNNASTLQESVEKVLFDIKETNHQPAILDVIQHHQESLQELESQDNQLKSINELLNNAHIQLEEAGHEARAYLDQLEIDPERLNQVEQRITLLHDVARKHHINPEQLPEHYQKLETQLNDMKGGEARYQELLAALKQVETDYASSAKKLHQSRVKSAEKLSKAIMEKLTLLGMSGGRFEVQINFDADTKPQKNGGDKVEFLVSANPGQALKAIGKVASGGELSRISLAIQVISQKEKSVPTFVFDEVDAGIGGATAGIVGQLLFSLTRDNQIFCVTHLPQVASFGDHHFHVSKSNEANSTHTEVNALSQDQRIEEIARMLGGLNITDKTRAHAKEMLQAKKHQAA